MYPSGHEPPVKPGTLIAFEGLDGSGKSTQLDALARALAACGRRLVATREPTDGSFGRRIRAMAASGEQVEPEEELRWFLEDRREHVNRVIAPALSAGSIVLTDRYYLSSVAYQGARGLDPEQILEQSEAEFPKPDLVLLLEIDPEEGLERTGNRAQPAEPAFEEQTFLERVAAIFASIERPYLERIDARGTPDAVHTRVREAIKRRLDLPLDSGADC
jgi:dTMP kinase